MPKLIDITIELSDGTEMDASVPDNWSDEQINQWANAQLGQGLKDPREAPVGTMNAFGLGAQRTGSEMLAGMKDVGLLGSQAFRGELGEGSQARDELIKQQRDAQRIFEEKTRDHPVSAALGQAAPFMAAGVGGGPTSAMLRGALAGGSLFEEDPKQRALNAAVGGVANRLGFNLLGKAGVAPTGARANRLGMVAPPEQRGPVLFPGAVQGTARFAQSAEKFADANQGVITEEALKMLRQSGTRFRSDTFEKADKEFKNLLSDALSDRSNVHLGGFKRQLDRLITDKRSQIADDPPTVKLLQRWRNNLDRPGKGDFLTPKEYQEFRSQLGIKAESFRKKPDKKIAVRQLIEDLDNAASVSLSPSKMKSFREARQLWRSIQLLKPASVRSDNGLIVPKNLRRSLIRNDENRFLFNRGEQPNLLKMLRLDEDIPVGAKGSRPGVTGRLSEGGGGLIITRPSAFLEWPAVGAARLPTRAIESSPLGLTVPNIPTLNLNPLLQE